MDKFLQLWDIQNQIIEAEGPKELEFIFTNSTYHLLSYDQCFFWEKSLTGITLKSSSGNAVIDNNSVFAQALRRIITKELQARKEAGVETTIIDVEANEVDENDLKDVPAFKSAALMLFTDKTDQVVAGLWIQRKSEFFKAELRILHELCSLYSYAYNNEHKKTGGLPIKWSLSNLPQKTRYALYVLMIVVLLFPVRMSATAPAEIVAKNPNVITVPFDGIVSQVNVDPGDKVEAGQTVAEMDVTILQGDVALAAEALSTARAQYKRLTRESLASQEKRGQLSLLQSQIKEKEIELEYKSKLLQQSDIQSDTEGVAIFSDKNRWLSKPVRTGEKIMQIASNAQAELLIRVPSDALIPISQETPVKFFLNIRPLRSFHADIVSVGYEPSVDSDGLLTYKIVAKPDTQNEEFRIGWKGSAVVYGPRTVLIYSILKRPLIALRNLFGF